MSNELLDILARRREDNQKEAQVSLAAGLIGQALVGETGGSVAAYGAKQAESAMAKSAKDDELAYQSAMKAQIEKQSLEGKKKLQADKFSHNELMELLKQKGAVGLENVKQGGRIDLEGAKQTGRVDLEGVKQIGRVDLEGAKQIGRVDLEGAKQGGRKELLDTRIKSDFEKMLAGQEFKAGQSGLDRDLKKDLLGMNIKSKEGIAAQKAQLGYDKLDMQKAAIALREESINSNGVAVNIPGKGPAFVTMKEAIEKGYQPLRNRFSVLSMPDGTKQLADRYATSTEEAVASKKLLGTTPEAEATGLTPNQVERIDKVVKEFPKDDLVKEVQDAVYTSQRGLKLLDPSKLNKSNSIAIRSGLKFIAKLSDTRLTDFDVKYILDPIGGIDKIDEFVDELVEGKSEGKIDKAREVYSRIQEGAQNYLKSKIKDVSGSRSYTDAEFSEISSRLLKGSGTELSAESYKAPKEELFIQDGKVYKVINGDMNNAIYLRDQ
jgi:hypothetical protein